jgi:hypothetical protein
MICELFLASPFELSCSLNRICLDQNNRFYDFANDGIWSTVGLTKFVGGFDAIYRRLNKHPNAFELDESQFDSSLFQELMLGNRDIRWSFLREQDRTPETQLRLWRLYDAIVYAVTVMENGELIQKDTGNPSGSSNTIVDNTMALFRLFAYAWIVLCKKVGRATSYEDFMANVEAALCGDDNTFTVSDAVVHFFNPTSIKEVWDALGVRTKTPCFSPRPLSEVQYLSQGFAYHDELGVWIPVPEAERVLSSLLYGSDVDDVRWHFLRACALRMDSWGNPTCRSVIAEYLEYLNLYYRDELVGTVDRPKGGITMETIRSNWKSDAWIEALYCGVENKRVSGVIHDVAFKDPLQQQQQLYEQLQSVKSMPKGKTAASKARRRNKRAKARTEVKVQVQAPRAAKRKRNKNKKKNKKGMSMAGQSASFLYNRALRDPFRTVAPLVEAGCFVPRTRRPLYLETSNTVTSASTNTWSIWIGSLTGQAMYRQYVGTDAQLGQALSTLAAGDAPAANATQVYAVTESARRISGGLAISFKISGLGLMPRVYAGALYDSGASIINATLQQLLNLPGIRVMDITPDKDTVIVPWKPADMQDYDFSDGYASSFSNINNPSLGGPQHSCYPIIIAMHGTPPSGTMGFRFDINAISRFECISGTDIDSEEPDEALALTADQLSRAAALDTAPAAYTTARSTDLLANALNRAAWGGRMGFSRRAEGGEVGPYVRAFAPKSSASAADDEEEKKDSSSAGLPSGSLTTSATDSVQNLALMKLIVAEKAKRESLERELEDFRTMWKKELAAQASRPLLRRQPSVETDEEGVAHVRSPPPRSASQKK